MTETKYCPCCKETKPISEFSKNKNRNDGYQSRCKACNKEHYQANKTMILAQKKDYRQANKGRIAAYKKEYRQTNKTVLAAINKEYYQANKAEIGARQKEYRQANKAEIAVYFKEYHQTNKDKVNSLKAKRRATKLQATPAWADLEAVSDFYTCAQAFRVYTGLEYQVDHIVPLQSKRVCGLHVPANLQLLEASENKSKGNRYWPDMP